MDSMVIIGIIAFVVIILVVVVILAMNSGSSKPAKKANSTSNSGAIKVIEIKNLDLPKGIEQLDGNILFGACKSIADSLKALGYANKSPNEMDKKEWHSWQLSILLCCVKNGSKFIFPDLNKVFHKTIMDLSEDKKKEERERIYVKYFDKVDISRNRDVLSKDVIWTAREVSILLYEILKEKR